MLQSDIDHFLADEKFFVNNQVAFQRMGSKDSFKLQDRRGVERYILDVLRRGHYRLTRCTYNERVHTSEVLLRLCMNDKPHRNPPPDGRIIAGPHLHIATQKFGDSMAYPLEEIEPEAANHLDDMPWIFNWFCAYAHIHEPEQMQRSF